MSNLVNNLGQLYKSLQYANLLRLQKRVFFSFEYVIGFSIIYSLLPYEIRISRLPQKYTNAALKVSLYACVYIKKYPENFAFLILRLRIQLFAGKVCKFFKK